MNPKITALLIGLTSLCLTVNCAKAGGFKIQDQSSRAMGMIDAFIAGADDASAVYYNPAGLTRLNRPQLIGNFYLAHAEARYEGPGGTDHSDGRIYALPNFFLGYPLDKDNRLIAGLGVYSPFGLGSKWDSNSPVRYHTTLAEIKMININPTLALAITDELAVGGGVNYYYSQVKMRHKINNPANVADGKQTVDIDGEDWGYNLGLLYELTDKIDLGFTYRSPVTVSHKGDLKVEHVAVPKTAPPGFAVTNLYSDVKTDLKYPALIGAGVKSQMTDDLRVELAAEWQRWSSRDVQQFEIAGDPPHLPTGVERQKVDWKDSWVLMLGAEYDLTSRWRLRSGYAFNQSPVPPETADPSLPPGDTHAASIGLGHTFRDNLTLDLAGVVSYQEKTTIKGENAPPESKYEAWGGYLAIGLTWEF